MQMQQVFVFLEQIATVWVFDVALDRHEAIAARDLGGALTAHSDGPGLGATFTLELPLKRSGTAS